MRILFLTSRLPYPPNRGDRLRVFNFIRQLANQHEIYLISFIDNDEKYQHLNILEDYCQQIHTVLMPPLRSILNVGINFWRSEPLQSLYYRSLRMQNLVDFFITNYPIDLIYGHLFRMAPYASKLHFLHNS